MSAYDAGSLKERVKVLRLMQTGNGYKWAEKSAAWAKAERTGRASLFSANGLGAEGWRFVLRVMDFRVTDLLQCNGRYFFPTYVEKDGGYLVAETGLVQVYECNQEGMNFPGVLTERYVGHQQQTPYDMNVIDYVLITPKEIKLDVGGIVQVGDTAYAIRTAHTIDTVKTEYEIRRVVDL